MKLPRLKEVRELHGWSQAKLAEESDVSRDSISNYETGHREAWPSTAKKLADTLGVEIAELVARAEEPFPLGEAPREARLDVAKLPGLDAAIRRHGMGRGELAYRARITPGELFDYEIGAKKPSEETIDRIADALGCNRLLLVVPSDQAEAYLAEERQQNAVIQDKRDEWLQEMREELLRNPAKRRTHETLKEAHRKEEERRASEAGPRKDDAAG